MNPLWKHQERAVSLACTLPGYALFFEMGAGKTRTAIEILRGKYNERKRHLRTLILAPPIVVRNWRDEWLRYSKVEPARVVTLTGSGKVRTEKFKKLAWNPDGVAQGLIFITNYESLLMDDLFHEFLRWAPEALVLDESHKCKDQKAKRTKRAIKLSEKVLHKYILSGSPILNSPLDIFSQFLILDGGQTFGKNFFTFRARYFRDKNAGMPRDRYFPNWVVMPGALEEINRLIHLSGMRVEKKDCLDLPPLVQQTVKVGMTAEQARVYKEMKRDLITYLNDKACVAQLAITKALRLQQVASGYIKSVDGEEIELDGNPKQEALKELLAEITPCSKVLVWAVFKQNYAQIRAVCDALGLEYVEVHGDISPAQKDINVHRFQTEDKVRVFLGHPGSGGIGINLVAASYSIFYSRTFSLEHSLQAEARNHRGGSEIHDKITRIDLVTDGTIDELVAERLAAKVEIGEAILKDLVKEKACTENETE